MGIPSRGPRLLAVVFLAAWACARPRTFAYLDGPTIRDPQGGQIFLRGFNLSGRSKLPPFFPVTDQGDGGYAEWTVDDLAPAQAAGLNAVRFLILWEAVEPTRGNMDSSYLDHVLNWVQALEARGYWVVLDMHQDVYSRSFKYVGDGAPAWSCAQSNYDAFAKLYDPTKPWFLNYFTQPVTACFDHLWQNGDGVSDEFANAWAAVAAKVSKEPGVLGFDLLNEPWPGSSPYSDGTFGHEELQPFYEKVMNAIRAVDPNHLFFLEPAAITVDTSANTGFEPMPDAGVVFFPHYYDLTQQATGTYGGNAATVSAFQYLNAQAARFGNAPWALGEFGDWSTDPLFVQEVQDVYAQVDASGTGVFWWDVTTLVDGAGGKACSQSICPLDAIGRPYPRRVAGTATAFAFDPVRNRVSLTFVSDAEASGTTDIVLPGTTWASGPSVVTADPGGWTGNWDAPSSVFRYRASGAGPHTITLTPGSP